MSIVTVTAARARDALGANTHFGWQNTPGWTVPNHAAIKAALQLVGIKYIRDAAPAAWNGTDKFYAELHKDLGVRLIMVVSSPDGSSDHAAIGTMMQATPGLLYAVEGANETNSSHAREDQQKLFDWVQAQTLMVNVDVLDFSLGADLQFTDAVGRADKANAHPYANSNAVYNGGLVGGYPGPNMRKQAAAMTAASPGMPQVFSEFGWSLVGGAWCSATDVDRAKYILSGWFTTILLGGRHAVLYELVDNQPAGGKDPEQAFGIFASDGTPHAAATAIHNVMAILADAGTALADPAPMAVTVSAGVNAVAVVKGDGSQWLTLWGETGGVSANVVLPSARASLALYDPIAGTSAVKTWANTDRATIAVPDHPVFLAVSQAPAAPPPPPPAPLATPSDMIITSPGRSFQDGRGNAWSLIAATDHTRGNQVAVNGVADATTSQVAKLVWLSGNVFQVNAAGGGWVKVRGTGGWVPVSADVVTLCLATA